MSVFNFPAQKIPGQINVGLFVSIYLNFSKEIFLHQSKRMQEGGARLVADEMASGMSRFRQSRKDIVCKKDLFFGSFFLSKKKERISRQSLRKLS